jgi:hypothetical protein
MVPLHTPWPEVLKQGHPFPPEPDCTGVPELQMYQSVVHWYEHVPFEQVWFLVNCRPLQFTPPDPQAQGLLLGGRQAPPQSDVPLGHAQVPFTHVIPAAQAVPHAPQLAGSLARVTHAPAHMVCPAAHWVVHWPEAQACPAAQTVPQAPQLAGSVARVTHAPEQMVCPGGHWVVHCPEAQACPAAQAVPQAPQLAGSLARVTQVPEHIVCPDAQPLGSVGAVQVPWTQVCPSGQWWLQCPQWCRSVVRFTQVLPHRVL